MALNLRQRWAEPVYTPGFRIREQRDRVRSRSTKVPKGLLPDLIAREYRDTQLVSHDTNAIAAMIAVDRHIHK